MGVNKRMDKKSDDNYSTENLKTKYKDGLKISYEKSTLKKKIPHLLEEISKNKKSLKIDSIITQGDHNIEDELHSWNDEFPKELYEPGQIDFIRRCKNSEEAFKILDYLLTRKEISQKEYDSLKTQIKTDKDLIKFINKHGGFKKPGYYERKFRNLIHEKSKIKK